MMMTLTDRSSEGAHLARSWILTYLPTGGRGGAGAMFCSSAATLAFTMLWLVSLYGAAASAAVMLGCCGNAPLPGTGLPTVTPALDRKAGFTRATTAMEHRTRQRPVYHVSTLHSLCSIRPNFRATAIVRKNTTSPALDSLDMTRMQQKAEGCCQRSKR